MSARFYKALFLMISLLLVTACDTDRSNGGQADDRSKLACVVTTDFYIVHFTAYQEPDEADRTNRMKAFSPYCQDLPHTGKSYLTVDLLDSDVKDTPISGRVVAIAQDKSTREVVTLPARTYKTGIVELVADLSQAGEYLVELQVGTGASEDESLRIPLHVALRPPLSVRLPLVGLGLGIFTGVMGLIALSGRLRRKHRPEINA